MSRTLFWLLLVGIVTLVAVDTAWAQGSWPEFPLSGNRLNRGPGGYLSWIKLGLAWGLFAVWVKTTDWVNRDCQLLKLPYALWNSVVFFPFFVGLFAMLTVPLFLIGWPLALLAWLVPLVVYIWKRNSSVEPHERVMTPDHLRHLFAEGVKSVGVTVDPRKKAPHEAGAQVILKARGAASDQTDQANMIEARQLPGFLSAKDIVAETVNRRADKTMLEYGKEVVAVRYQIDGVWHDSEPQDRENADPMLVVFKLLAALNPKERRARQEGYFAAEFHGHSYDIGIVSQGTKTGERVVLQRIQTEVDYQTFEELGMRAKLQEQVRALLKQDKGIVLFSAMPAGGLTSTFTVAQRMSDRYMGDYIGVMAKKAMEPVVENVEIATYDAAAGQSPAAILPQLIRKQPNVLVMFDLPDAETVKILCKAAQGDQQVLAAIRSKEAVEALLRVLLLKVPAKEFAPAVTAVVNQRLVRRLCTACKENYEPPADLLKKLGIPKGRVQYFYRPPENPEEVCPECDGIGYRGRTAIFELLIVDDKIREALIKQPKLDVLRKVSRAAGNRSLQEEGILVVARGETSLAELKRVLDQ
jgi:type II secretory ATPase GspE/PulE/Tfp pilus assembly ATPase PilB-like protein